VGAPSIHGPGGRVKVLVRLGRQFSKDAGFSARALELPEAATIEALLKAIGKAAPGLSCVDEATGAVDLALANLSINGRAVNPLEPGKVKLHDGDTAYLYGTISGG